MGDWFACVIPSCYARLTTVVELESSGVSRRCYPSRGRDAFGSGIASYQECETWSCFGFAKTFPELIYNVIVLQVNIAHHSLQQLLNRELQDSVWIGIRHESLTSFLKQPQRLVTH